MALAPQLDDLIKSFSTPALGLVKAGPEGIGLAPALFEAFMDEPHLVLQARQKGVRVSCPGVTDCPDSRRILDRIAEDHAATEQAGALLSGEVDGVFIFTPVLLHLLSHVPLLPVASIAALHKPTDIYRRAEVAQWLAATVESDRLPSITIRGMVQIDRQNYADFPARLPGSQFLGAWLGLLPVAFSE